ncbi:MAG: hypothetical protein ACERKD_24850 [Prolixibacteraceae bacterium]
MKKLVVLIVLLIPFVGNSQSLNFFLKSSVGLSKSITSYDGVSTDIKIGYNLFKYVGVEMSTNNTYLYNNDGLSGFAESFTNTGIGIGIIVYPISFKGHSLQLVGGYTQNILYLTTAYVDPIEPIFNAATSSRNFSISPYWGGGYFYQFKRIAVGIDYRQNRIKKYTGGFTNKQYLFSLIKSF